MITTRSARYDSLFEHYAGASGVDWLAVKAQAQAESGANLDPGARSGPGAVGLAQFMSKTWAEWADGTPGVQELPPHELLDPRNPEAAIRAMCAMMAWLLTRPLIGGDRRKALAAYNWGMGNLARCLAAHGDAWLERAPIETRDYVARIERFYAALEKEGSTR